jgi:YaiO family outer membrane protein
MIFALIFGMSLAASGRDSVVVGDSTRSLTTPPWWEVDLSASSEVFASRLSMWQWHSVAVRYRGRSESHAIEGFTARRYDIWNSGFAAEESSTLGRGAYVALRAQVAPGAMTIARSDLSAMWYQTIGRGWEIIPSARLMSFSQDRIPIFGLGVGRYVGLWYFNGRVSDANQSGERGLTTSVDVRRYQADASPNFFDASASFGHDVAVLSQYVVTLRQTASLAARAQRMVSPRLGVSLGVSYEADQSLPDRYGVALSTFIRW